MHSSCRVSKGLVRRLYDRFKIGIYDEDLLLEVGWALYCRGEDVLTVSRAYRGNVPCPVCGAGVARQKVAPQPSPTRPEVLAFTCTACRQTVTWRECREALRGKPVCFECGGQLAWVHALNILRCGCGRQWTWQAYRQSVKTRVRLPCPHCSAVLRHPGKPSVGPGLGDARVPHDEPLAACSRCGGVGKHADAKFICADCGFEQKWSNFAKRLKRRAERLSCQGCGHTFTWQKWKAMLDKHLLTGIPQPVEEYVLQWPRCGTPAEKMMRIDSLLHALHCRGSLAPLFIEGTELEVRELLDALAYDYESRRERPGLRDNCEEKMKAGDLATAEWRRNKESSRNMRGQSVFQNPFPNGEPHPSGLS